MNSDNIPFTAAAVAALLPGVWTTQAINPHSNTVGGQYLKRDDGLTLWFRSCYSESKKFRCSWDQPACDRRYGNGYSIYDNGQKLDTPGISFSKDKTPEVIAADIRRRLLPDCERIEPLARQFVRDIAESYGKQDAARDRLAAILEHTPSQHAPYQVRLNKSGNYDRGYGDANVREGGNVDFDIKSLPSHRAFELAELLKTFFAKA